MGTTYLIKSYGKWGLVKYHFHKNYRISEMKQIGVGKIAFVYEIGFKIPVYDTLAEAIKSIDKLHAG